MSEAAVLTPEAAEALVPFRPVSIALENVSKVYRLYPSPLDQMCDALGLNRLRFWHQATYPEFPALDDVNLTLHQGERVGVVGRNGAGKTTLLKLITGNFRPTAGRIAVDGKVQALMQVGLGFHPEFTGYENIRSSLVYNGLTGERFDAAVADVADFVELGDFLHQPVKTYSMGMSARLQFATATAIDPEILIVDEVLGAGDAYFSAKCADRMERLASSGCTLLLVSHSMAQVLEFCERAIWLENGRVVLEDDALSVVKAYEEYMQRLQREAEAQRQAQAEAPTAPVPIPEPAVTRSRWLREKLLKQVLGAAAERSSNTKTSAAVTSGGLSRWHGEGGLRIAEIRVLDGAGEPCRVVRTGEPLTIEVAIEAERADRFTCIYVVVLFTEDGRWVSRHCSKPVEYTLAEGERRRMRLVYDQTLLGNGKFVFSAAIYRVLDLENLASARYYDLLSRSFEVEVKAPYPDDTSILYHPARWVVADEA